MNNCPFCGAKGITAPGPFWSFACRTMAVGSAGSNEYARSVTCYEAQLTAQAALLEECLEVVRRVTEVHVHHDYIQDAVAALLPKLEAAKEEK